MGARTWCAAAKGPSRSTSAESFQVELGIIPTGATPRSCAVRPRSTRTGGACTCEAWQSSLDASRRSRWLRPPCSPATCWCSSRTASVERWRTLRACCQRRRPCRRRPRGSRPLQSPQACWRLDAKLPPRHRREWSRCVGRPLLHRSPTHARARCAWWGASSTHPLRVDPWPSCVFAEGRACCTSASDSARRSSSGSTCKFTLALMRGGAPRTLSYVVE
jgi:hypothetical protein